MLNLIVWVKTNPGQGSFYRSQHELIGVFRVGDTPHLNTIELGRHGRNRSNVWQYAGANTFRADRLDDLRAHPTVKPVAMIADAMKDCTRRSRNMRTIMQQVLNEDMPIREGDRLRRMPAFEALVRT